SLISSSSFSFSCSSYHLDLHSFPTRRSSDLAAPVARDAQRLAHRVLERARPDERRGDDARRGERIVPEVHGQVRGLLDDVPARADRKSTTSELQSRENLVCRLLLEKKNNKTH